MNEQSFVADLDALLAPISSENPAGSWLRYTPVYDDIENARIEDDATLPQGIYVRELKKADWPLVESLCFDALCTQSKDLQLAAWLAEAWVHRYGFDGLREGLRLLQALAEGYWDFLYPSIDDDLEGRIAPIEWVDDKLSIKLRMQPVTSPSVGDLPALSWAEKEKAEQQAQSRPPKEKGRQDESGDGVSSGARFQTTVTMTPTAFFHALYRSTAEIQEEIDRLVRTLEPRCGKATPRFQRIRQVNGSIRQFATRLLEERQENLPLRIEPASLVDAEGGHVELDTPRFHFGSRAEAYRMLLEAAEYLARVEPHSPTPYLVRRAVSWGGMTLVDLLEELVKDRGDRTQIFELLGVGKA